MRNTFPEPRQTDRQTGFDKITIKLTRLAALTRCPLAHIYNHSLYRGNITENNKISVKKHCKKRTTNMHDKIYTHFKI
jgi:hypothetical protein